MKKLMMVAGGAVLASAAMADGAVVGPDEEMRTLGEQATNAMTLAYAPYSHFRVGAAVKGASGKINLFSDPKTFKLYLRKSPTEFKSYTLEELLPESFGPESL